MLCPGETCVDDVGKSCTSAGTPISHEVRGPEADADVGIAITDAVAIAAIHTAIGRIMRTSIGAPREATRSPSGERIPTGREYQHQEWLSTKGCRSSRISNIAQVAH